MIALIITLNFSFTGCGRADVSVSGDWGRRIESYDVRLTFTMDGNFQLQVGDRARRIDGLYDVEADIIVLTDEDCGELEGRYRIERSDNVLTFSALNDACEGRTLVLDGIWKLEK